MHSTTPEMLHGHLYEGWYQLINDTDELITIFLDDIKKVNCEKNKISVKCNTCN